MRPCLALVVVLAVVLVGCAVDDLKFSPVFDTPPASDTAAYPYTAIDSITLSIANEGEHTDLVSTRFERGDSIQLTDVPFGDHLVMHAVGALGMGAAAYGRTCAFALSPDATAPAPHLFFSNTQRFAATDIAPLARANGRVVPYQGTALFLAGDEPRVEQFDPRTGAMVVLDANLNVTARADAALALIGVDPARVLLVGGTVQGDASTSVELFDAVAGREVVDTDQLPFVGLSATSLADGTVVVIGGNVPGTNKAAVGSIVEVSTSASGVTVRNRATMQHPRTGHTATALGTSEGASVLIAGGTENEGSGNTIYAAELYKPLQHVLSSSFNAEMAHPRTLHKAVLMPDGSVLFIGGIDAMHQPVRALERFTIEEGFSDAKDFSGNPLLLPTNVGVVDNSVTMLPDGRVLVAGGRPDPASPGVNTAVFLQLDNLMGQLDLVQAQEMRSVRVGHQATLLCDGTVLLTGGDTSANTTAERYNPVSTGRR